MATKKKAESDLAIGGIKLSREKLLSIGIVMLLTISGIATLVYYKDNYDNSNTGDYSWIDPIPRNSTTDATLGQAGDANHSHNEPLDHWLWSPNMTLIDYHNLNCDGEITGESRVGRPCFPEFKNTAPTTGEFGEIVTSGDFPDCVVGCYAYVAAYHNMHILDISKPNDIQMLSTYYAETARIIDVKVTDDNNWALVNHEATNLDDDGNPLDPAPSDVNWGANEIHLLDISDKTEPKLVSRWSNPPAGYHNQEIWLYEDGDVFLFLADPIGESANKGTQIAKLFEQNFFPEGQWIQPWAVYQPDSATTCGGSIFNHDNVVRKHPVTGQVLMYISYWDAGLRILDVSNPPSIPSVSWPEEIGRWLGCPSASSGWYGPDGGGHGNMSAEEWTGSSEGNGNIHYAVPFDELIDGRHYTVIAPEFGSNDAHTGTMRLIDTTDPTKPFLVSDWKLPGNHTIPGNYMYSPHNGDTGTEHIYWTHYHAGAWVTDAGTVWDTITWKEGAHAPDDPDFNGFFEIEQLGTIETLSYYLPHGPDWIENAGTELDYNNSDGWTGLKIPFNWGLHYDPRGFIYVSDIKTGVYVVQYDGDKQADYLFPPLYDQ